MTDYWHTHTTRELITTAHNILTPNEYAVWLTKHIAGKGRRTGSLTLGITQEAWRYRLHQADRKLANHLQENQAAVEECAAVLSRACLGGRGLG